jgi:hypothetical protein
MHLESVLPEEILLEIFSEIDKSDLKRFLEISKEWRNLLIRNAKVMRKLPLMMINDSWKEKIEFVENYGKFIREVNFSNAIIESFEDILNILKFTPNVEKLSLINVKFTEKTVGENEEESEEKVEEKLPEKLHLKRLTEIVVEDEENVGALKFVASHFDIKMTSLKCDLNDDAQLPILTQFLSECHHIQSLEISSTLDAVFGPSDDSILGFPFQLEKLTVKTILMKFDEQFAKFLRSQRQLKSISLIADHVDFRYHQMMFSHFLAVKRIQLNVDALGTSDCLSKMWKIPSNKSIESLTVLGLNQHLNVFDALIRIFPNLNQLRIQNMTHFRSDKLQNLPLLTQLKVDCANREYLSVEQLSKLKTAVIIAQPKETYERNLQNFCDLSRFGDKHKDTIEAF